MNLENQNPTAADNPVVGNPASAPSAPSAPSESFSALLDEYLTDEALEGSVLRGTVVSFLADRVVVDVGLKSEGHISAAEFERAGELEKLKIGDTVEVYLEWLENSSGSLVLSRERARREEAWVQLIDFFERDEPVEGQIFNRVKGGYVVDLVGSTAFLPASQVDIRPQANATHLMGMPQRFKILKMDRNRGNVVVSRRVLLEEERSQMLTDTLSKIKEGEVMVGIVKNVTEYGAFVDLGGVDGLLHVTDISWQRVNHPSEHLNIGQQVTVQVTRFNAETKRISLGMKQLEADPWRGAAERFPIGERFKGRVSNTTDYGAFVQLEPGIEGLVHVSEMSWAQRNVHPRKMVSISQEVEVVILDINEKRRRVSLGMKQTILNPWTQFATENPPGSKITGKIKNITSFGLFIELMEGIDGMVHLADLSWTEPGESAIKEYEKGQEVSAQVVGVSEEKCRISLSIKELEDDPHASARAAHKVGQVVTCTVSKITGGGIEVQIGDDNLAGFIRKGELARDRAEQHPDRFAPGEKVDAKITSFERKDRRMQLSIRQLLMEEEKEAIREFGSAESGAQLGEILGASGRKQLLGADESEGGGEGEVKPARKPRAPKKGAAAKAKAEAAEAAAAEAEAAPEGEAGETEVEAQAAEAAPEAVAEVEAQAAPETTTEVPADDAGEGEGKEEDTAS